MRTPHAFPTPQVLVIEDDPDIARLVALHLRDLPAQATLAHDGPQGLALALGGRAWDAIVLDIGLPGLNGLDLTRALRQHGPRVPLLMLSARSSERDRVLGLELGADDYLTKPFSVVELQARVKALLRRAGWSAGTPSGSPSQDPAPHQARPTPLRTPPWQAGALRIDHDQRRVWLQDQEVLLTPREFDLLWYFAQHPGQVVKRQDLLDQVWGHGHDGYEHTVNTHINRLRSKLGDTRVAGGTGGLIHTVWGVGYRFDAHAPAQPAPARGLGAVAAVQALAAP